MAGDLLSPNKLPSSYDLTLLFEMIDETRSGMISAGNLRSFLELTHRMKEADFDIKRYNDQLGQRDDIKARYDQVQVDLEDLVAEFDLTGDRLISPEEFFNIIMAYYE